MSLRRLASIVLLAAVAASTLVLSEVASAAKARPSAKPPVASVPDDFFGVNGGVGGPSTSLEAQVDLMAGHGIRVVRQHLYWSYVEPTAPHPLTGAHSYRWDVIDRFVGGLARQGIEFAPVLAYSTTWASPALVAEQAGATTRVRPAMAPYVAFVSAVARRYGRGGEFWTSHPELPAVPITHYEIWNEQNVSDYWQPQETVAEDYFDLYLRSRAALRQVDPQAVTVVGGLVQRGAEEFVQAMYRHRPSARGRVDAIGYHVYAANTASDVVYAVRNMRRAIDSTFGKGVEIELSEVGWSSVGVDEADRKKQFTDLARLMPVAKLGVSRMMPYVWFSDCNDAPQNWDQGLGLTRSDATLLPGGEGYVAGIAQARAADVVRARMARRMKRA